MQIDLNDPQQFSLAGVGALLGSETDAKSWQLRVTSDGIAYLSSVVGATDIQGLAFRFETWDAGNGYVGEAAAADGSWVERIFNALKKNWPKPASSYIEFF